MADIDDLDSTTRELLAAYRSHAGPSPEATGRLLAALRRSAALPRSAAAPAEARPRLVPNRRWTTVAVAGLLAAAVVAALRLTAGPAVEARPEAGHAAPDSVDAPPSTPVSHGGVVTPGAVREPMPASPPVPKDSPAATPRVPRAAPTRPADPPAPSLAAELAFMRTVQAELGAGAPARALALLDEHPARFPGGHLREEVEALRVVAGCGVRLDAASQAAAAGFVQARPGSLFGQRVRTACGLP